VDPKKEEKKLKNGELQIDHNLIKKANEVFLNEIKKRNFIVNFREIR